MVRQYAHESAYVNPPARICQPAFRRSRKLRWLLGAIRHFPLRYSLTVPTVRFGPLLEEKSRLTLKCEGRDTFY
jgi:hypothetical protein